MVPKTRVFQAADGDDLVILASPFLTDPPVWQMDGRKDRRTDRIAMARNVYTI